jgi:tRNA pseudouridine38/39 synthase
LIQIILKNKTNIENIERKRDKKGKTKFTKAAEKLNFAKLPKVKIAIKFSYIGTNYSGLVVQKHSENTVEGKIIEALKLCCLIDPKGEFWQLQFNRCGRTDKGVSAAHNVISLIVRKLPGKDYLQRVNRCLPSDIRFLAFIELTDLP